MLGNISKISKKWIILCSIYFKATELKQWKNG